MPNRQFASLLGLPMQLGECPLWHAQEQALYWIDIAARQVHRARADGTGHTQWALPSEPGCIAFTDAGPLVVAMRHGISLLDTRTGKLEHYADAPYDPQLGRFNDGRCDSHGRLWLGSLDDSRTRPSGSLYCLEKGRLRDLELPVTVSNGIAFSSDGRRLYHADTTAHRVRKYRYEPTSSDLTEDGCFLEFSPQRDSSYRGRPDGATVDAEDAYWCAMFEGGYLLRTAADGTPLEEIALPVRCPTMMAFGGPDLRTLYITSARHNRAPDELERYPLSGHVLALQVEVAGRPEYVYRL